MSYCHGSKKMLAFVIVMPSSIPAIAASAAAAAAPAQWGFAPAPSFSFHSPPPDIAVVPTTEHQFPLGVVSWGSASREAQSRSHAAKLRLSQLADEFRRKAQLATNAAVKADIIQALIRSRSGEIRASEVWEKHKWVLDDTSKREISMWVHLKVDANIIPFYFPDLPDPMSREEHARTARRVEEYDEEAKKARRELDKQQYLGL
jgi:hypothetical protein